MISNKELDNLIRIGNISRECVGEEQFSAIMTQELVTLFHSESAVFMEFEHQLGNSVLVSCSSYGIDEQHGREYLAHYHKIDPCYQQLLRAIELNPQASISTNQVIENQHDYVNSKYYNEFLVKTGVHQSLIFTLANGQYPVGLIGLHRSKTKHPYTNVDHLKAQIIAPYLSNAVMFRRKEREFKKKALLNTTILKHSNIDGYLLFNQHLICIDCDGKSRTLQQHNVDTYIGAPCEQLVAPEVVTLLKNKLHSQLVSAPRLCGEFDNLVQAEHIRVEAIKTARGETHLIILFLNKTIVLVNPSRMEYFQLTERQMEIVKLVQYGYTNPQISSKLGISAKTVENHLTSIYAKTATHNKTSLMRQLHV